MDELLTDSTITDLIHGGICPGSTGPWEGEPLPRCPECERTPGSMGLARPGRWPGGWEGKIPHHWRLPLAA